MLELPDEVPLIVYCDETTLTVAVNEMTVLLQLALIKGGLEGLVFVSLLQAETPVKIRINAVKYFLKLATLS
jgi:hypothetical protein